MENAAKKQRYDFRMQLPENVREWLSVRAKLNDRTMNAEALQIFKAVMAKGGSNPTGQQNSHEGNL